MGDVLQRLLTAPGTYWGQGDGPESGEFVGRIVVEPMLSAVLLRYEAYGKAGLQHVEYTVLGRTSTGLQLHAVIDTRPEVMNFSEAEPRIPLVSAKPIPAISESGTLGHAG